MPRSFDVSAHYTADATRVYRALGERSYWEARLADSGADDATLDALETVSDGAAGGTGGLVVRTTQVLRAASLPGVVTAVHRGDLTIARTETWSALHEGVAHLVVSGAIEQAPVTLAGTGVLSADGAGTTLALRATVTVRIPLVGGRIETLIGDHLADLLAAEQRFTTAWIDGGAR